MAWVTFSAADIRAVFSDAEKAACDAASGDDKLAEIASAVAGEVRGYVRSRATVPSGDALIPASLVSAAAAIGRYRFLNSLPIASLQTDGRKEEARQAIDLLKSVRTGGFAIDDADSGETTHTGPSFTVPSREFTRANQDGL